MDKTVLNRLASAYDSAYCALMYVTDPARWPAFAAFAEQHTNGREWPESDREEMREDARVILAIGDALDPDTPGGVAGNG